MPYTIELKIKVFEDYREDVRVSVSTAIQQYLMQYNQANIPVNVQLQILPEAIDVSEELEYQYPPVDEEKDNLPN